MKLSCIVSCPISTYSGYGARSRDFVRALIETRPDWDVKILPQRWGNTRQGFLEDMQDTFFTPRIISSVTQKPDVWIQITIPNEFQPVGNFNIGVTAGIETTVCDSSWIKGCNNMHLVIGSSEHTKEVLTTTGYQVQDKNNNVVDNLINKAPVEVLLEGVDLNVFKKLPEDQISLDLSEIKENFLFLTVGHWMQGSFGNDRKNIAYTIKCFSETFKNIQNPPALLLKTLQSNSSILDKTQVLTKINELRKTVKGNLPNIYLLHGELTDNEMNHLYNHPKVKCLVSLTKGEGFGRPMAEFACIGKPIIASNWSGQKDFLKPEFTTLIDGTLHNVDESSVVKNMILKESKWFKPNDESVYRGLRSLFKEYKSYLGKSQEQSNFIINNFSYESMKSKLEEILLNHFKPVLQLVDLDLQSIKLPKLKRIE